jgi:predicted ThiF/HesA family dinucleotide-utilizing enzyme
VDAKGRLRHVFAASAPNELWLADITEHRTGVGPVDSVKAVPFCCECGRIGCSDIIELPLREYERVRGHPKRFFVVDGHQIDAVESVVARHEAYVVVEKRDLAGAIAEERDPRSDG